jgi:hypothetical protein
MINVAKKVIKQKIRTLLFTSFLTLFKCKVQIFVKLGFKLLLSKIVSPIHP